MYKLDFETFIHGVGNDLKIAIDEIMGAIEEIHNAQIKERISKPDKIIAQALLEYLTMEDGKAKQNIQILAGENIKLYLAWVDSYCAEHSCTQEQALTRIIAED